MPTIAELYGHEFGSALSKQNLAAALCPFMQATCDGGGNRDMATASLALDPGLRARFNPQVVKSGSVACAICSVNVKKEVQIICPNRLFYLGSSTTVHPYMQSTLDFLCTLCGYSSNDKIAFWKEVTVKQTQRGQVFDARLDYVLRKVASDGSYEAPFLLEVMTCSTSGGNRRKGTDIATAFRKAILATGSSSINSPGVNIRQVWARMASQLIVKSEAAMHWGGRSFWIIQDTLADYINKTTGLDLSAMRSTKPDEVNIIVRTARPNDKPILYAGPIQSSSSSQPSFSDILKAPFLPSLSGFVSNLSEQPDGFFNVK